MRLLHVFLTLALILFITLSHAQVTVKPGDTLWGLAKRYNTTPTAILAANGLTGTDLFPGAILKLPADATPTPDTYTVRTGDTLYDIAAAFSMSIDELLAINNLDGAIIRPGDVLRTTLPQTPPAPLVVTVVPGDSLWSIAQATGTSVAALRAANSLSSETINPGVALTIPGRYADPSSADRGGTTPPTIKVARGDTLWDIAKRYNTTVATLMAANELSSQNLNSGQVLRIVTSNDIVRATPTEPTAAPTGAVMLWPLHGAITSKFGYRQLRISGSNFHTGLDIDGDTGDPIVSATTGLVTYSGWRSGYGNLVVVRTGNTEYYYGHASKLLVTEGEAVGPGQLIALVGSTGRSTGSHLHFEIRVDGAPVDPLPLLEQYATR